MKLNQLHKYLKLFSARDLRLINSENNYSLWTFSYILTQQTGILLQVELLFILLILPQLCSCTLLHYLQDLHLHSI